MVIDQTKKFFVDTRRKIIENAENLLNESVSLYNLGFYSRAAFLAMTCIEECGKLWLIRLASINPTQIDLSQLNKELRNHTIKTLNSAMGFFINSAADRRQGLHPLNKMSITSGIILLVRSEKWMEWRNSCLYTDISIQNNLCKTPNIQIKQPEACYFIRMAFEGLIDNAYSGYKTKSDLFGITSTALTKMSDSEIVQMTKEFTELNEKADSFYQKKITELEKFISENKNINLSDIDFLKNPEKYQKLAEELEKIQTNINLK